MRCRLIGPTSRWNLRSNEPSSIYTLLKMRPNFVVFCDCFVHEFLMWFRSKQFLLTLYKCEANLAQHDNMSLHCKQSYDLC